MPTGSRIFPILLFLASCVTSPAQEPSVVDRATGIRIQVVTEDTLPALKIVLPGRPASDPGVLVLFPEHVTVREHGKTDSKHLYLFRPGTQSRGPVWRRVGQSLQYEMELTGSVRMIARATLDPDGVRFHYDFVSTSKVDYDVIQAVTDPRMISPQFHDLRLERTFVHHADGFDLLASETPARLTQPLNQWLPNRYRASYTWPIEPLRVEKKEDGITWYNKSRRVDEPFLATKSIDGKWILATLTHDPGNVWSNPELTCQHADPATSLKAGGHAGLELKILILQGALEDVLIDVRQQRDQMANRFSGSLP
jgi:hypothetical protein